MTIVLKLDLKLLKSSFLQIFWNIKNLVVIFSEFLIRVANSAIAFMGEDSLLLRYFVKNCLSLITLLLKLHLKHINVAVCLQ